MPDVQITKTTCPYCGVGCGLEVIRRADGQIEIEGDKTHPANHGRLCSKGMALAQTLGLSDRSFRDLLLIVERLLPGAG